jgi:hypothetical protein
MLVPNILPAIPGTGNKYLLFASVWSCSVYLAHKINEFFSCFFSVLVILDIGEV